ncbi:MAG TPA: aminopeptidase [Candidatus Hydrothermia bacterium]|nr:aminopeptidase [Candidatus Hydrothermae bacterium]HOP32443.1 aminopeptidase [Candidatus Hydrothermia bacterium]
MKFKIAWDFVKEDDVFNYAEIYREFLSKAKTERETVEYFTKLVAPRQDVRTYNFRNKSLVLYKKGKSDILDGFRILAAHIDAPRIDIKQNPLYEDTGIVLLETHYYGGIKTYQWVTKPMAIKGVVVKKDRSSLRINIGDEPGDPVFTFTDILPHLSKNVQAGKKISEAVHGEKLDLLFGSIPVKGEDDKIKEKVMENIISILRQKYNIEEEDLISAELEVVPQGPAFDVGIDRSMIGGYGQDDRVCAYAAVKALLDAENLARPTLVILFDKEEIGSDGNTGAESMILEFAVSDVLKEHGVSDYASVRKVLYKSEAISGDVTAGVDPNWKEVHELKNAAKLGYGIAISKYTGSGGKYATNDAHAEFVAKIVSIFEKEEVVWQVAELGKVDEGGGGTVAKYLSKFGIDTIDAGTPLLSMHSPFEIASKVDIYMTYKAYKAFVQTE